LTGIPDFPGLKTLIRVESERDVYRADIIEVFIETRYYVISLIETAACLAQRIRGYWGVENKVHSVRDVTQGEEACRLRTVGLVQCWAARNFALNLDRDRGFQNMAQAQRLAGFSCSILKDLFSMK
jgi:hypothetical protein